MRYALRQLLRTPSFTAIAVLTLAIGIATNTTIFAIVDELVLKPAREVGDEHVLYLNSTKGYGVQIPDYELLLNNPPDGISAIAAYESQGRLLAQVPGRAAYLAGLGVSGQYVNVHQVRAQEGRWISADDNIGGELDPKIFRNGVAYISLRGTPGADVVVISDRLWRDWFGADRGIVGRQSITINKIAKRIIGVAPPGFESAVDVWIPFGRRRLLTREELEANRMRWRPGWVGPLREPTQPGIQVMVRSEGNSTIQELNDRLTAAVSARAATIDSPRGSMRLGRRGADDRYLSTGYTILGFAALVLIAACANLGNMMFARAAEREGELATRLALGATQFGIFRLIIAETALICGAGSVLGTLLSAAALELFTDAVPAFQVAQYWRTVKLDLGLDWRVFSYAASAGVLATLFVGLGSLWRSNRTPLLARLAASGPAVVAKTEGRTLRTMLVAVQVTAAVLLLITTGMLLENTSKQLDRRILFDITSLVAARIELPDEYDEARGPHFFNLLLTRVLEMPGVSAAAIADALPAGEAPSPRRGRGTIIAEAPPQGLSDTPVRLDGQWIYGSPGLLETLELQVVKGRNLRDDDRAGTAPVVLITASTASRLWPDDDPIGKRLTCCEDRFLRTVVGVLPDPVESRGTAQAMSISEAIQKQSSEIALGTYVILPAAQKYSAQMLMVVRTSSPDAAAGQIGQAVVAVDPSVPVFAAGPVHTTQFGRAAAERAVRTLAGSLGVVSFCIAMFGVFAVVSYFVTRRKREFGLRLALGATRGQIVKLVVDYSIHLVLIGLLPGVLFASLGTRYFQVELTKLRPNGLTIWVFVPLVMLAAGIVAAYLPARRASRVDPYQSLRDT